MRLKTLLLFIIFSLNILGCKEALNQNTNTSQTNYFDLVRENITGDVAYETTAFVEKYWRVPGNTGFNASINQVALKLEEAGYVLEENATPKDIFTYRIEKKPMNKTTWEPVDASLSIVGDTAALLQQSTNRNMVYLNSISTPEGGVTGEVVYIKNKEAIKDADINGKIVFAEMSVYPLYKQIIEGNALGIITYNNPSYLQPKKNNSSIQFRSLPYTGGKRIWGIALSYAAKERLKAALKNGKIEVNVEIETKIYPSEELTLVADIKGSELPKQSLVFSAHVQEPGANDNASGVGAQLEMAMVAAKLIKENKLDAKRTLTFLWGDEIRSTQRYIEEKDKRSADINWGISLDMVGENTAITGGSFLIEKMPDPSAIWTRGKDKHSEWGGEVLSVEDMKPHYLNDLIIDVFKKQGEFANWEVNTNPFEGGSDHTPFLRADIPGLLLWHFTDQFYHTDNDRIDKVSKETLKNVSTGALVSAFTLINADYSTAQQVIQIISNTAKARLNDEFELSKTAITEGKLVADETKIITTWNDWYFAALASIEDLVPEPNQALKDEISVAQEELKALTKQLIDKLNK